MTRFALVIAAGLVGGCFHPHPEGQQELTGEDCFSCHATDYAATAAPAHRDMPDVYATTCNNCHQMTSWKPALDGKHSDVFPIAQGDHAKIACQDCHDLASPQPSLRGADTNCLGCHPDEPRLSTQHVDVDLFEDVPYSYKPSVANFCLECHPAGLAEEHPEDDFARKDDHAVACSQCHDRTAGPDTSNVTCVESRCHHTVRETDDTDGHKDGDYQKSRGKGTDRDFCHECH
jgi:hypothetical protein